MATLEISREYGYLFLTVFATWVVHHMYMSIGVMNARKQYTVKYPLLYAPPTHPQADKFNAVQRGHQNSLENLPMFVGLLLCAGLLYPGLASLFGCIYLAGRVVYFNGYASKGPDGRMGGMFMYFGLFPLLLIVLGSGVRLLAGW